MSNSCSHRHTRMSFYYTSATEQRHRASEKENGSKKVFIEHHIIQFHSMALKPALAPWKQESWINLWRWGRLSSVQVKFKNIKKYHFQCQKKMEGGEKNGNNSQQNTLRVFRAMFFKQESLLMLKNRHEVLSSYIQISKINNGKCNLTSVCTIKTTL